MFKSIHRVSAQGATLFMAQAVRGCAVRNGLAAMPFFPVSTQARAAASGMAPR
jgi:hypothetical protein